MAHASVPLLVRTPPTCSPPPLAHLVTCRGACALPSRTLLSPMTGPVEEPQPLGCPVGEALGHLANLVTQPRTGLGGGALVEEPLAW